MEKKITLYVVATTEVVEALDAESVKVVENIYVVKTGEEIEGVPFTSKRQAQDASELVAKFGIEAVVCSQKRVVKLA